MGKKSEAVLAALCQKGFLSLWSFPNPYNDNGLSTRGEGKELCDLLVIFGSDVIIFSDKSCQFLARHGVQADWMRWHRKTVHGSVKQIRGAERWLLDHPNRTFADNRCKVPIKVPCKQKIRVHRVIVALGAENACRSHFGGGSGSLPIASKLVDGNTTGIFTSSPFVIGGEGLRGEHFHIFDELTLTVVMKELDTARDFLEYLQSKEKFLESFPVNATGEEDLLAYYLRNSNRGRHSFPEPVRDSHAFIDESNWKSLELLPQYRNGKIANSVSYAWDNLIEYFTTSWRDGNVEEPADRARIELPLRLMASTNRLMRRSLGRLVSQVLVAQRDERNLKFLATADHPNPRMAFGAVGIPVIEGMDLGPYRERRQQTMLIFARSLKLRMPTLESAVIIGIGTTPQGVGSEDIALIDLTEWSEQIELETRADMKTLGIGADPSYFVEQKFPNSPDPPKLRKNPLRRGRRG